MAIPPAKVTLYSNTIKLSKVLKNSIFFDY